MRHINIPVFIPHLGCPNDCVFCNQRLISGTLEFKESDVVKIIDGVLSTACDAECEIAFFGGSFTGIDRELMIRLLDTAEKYVKRGDAVGIRMSTRPDYIDDDICTILSGYTVTQVELGIQSMSDAVLVKSRRGHTSDDTVRAVNTLRRFGFEVVGQMMVGLPGSSAENELLTANAICDLGCAGARVYPTIVFKGTELDRMYMSGEYVPLSTKDAVVRCADVLDVFERRGVKCLRVGLCDSENLHSDKTYSAGPDHPAIGELAAGELFYRRIRDELLRLDASALTGKSVKVECPPGAVSKVVGNGRCNSLRLCREFGIKSIKAIEKDCFSGYNIKVLFE